MQKMPTGHYARRRAETGFRTHLKEALEWIEWLNFLQELQLQHEANRGEKRVGSRGLPVDGYNQERGMAYQYHRCYWHSSCTCFREDTIHPTKNKTMAELRQMTEAISTHVQKVLGEGHLVEMWGCQWGAMKRNHPDRRRDFGGGEERHVVRDPGV